MSKQNKNDKDIYKPYSKNDFRDLWYNEDNNMIESFKIIRQLTDEEKKDFEKVDDYDEEMYLIKTNKGEEWRVFDIDVLKECEIDNTQWHKTLMHMVDSMEYDEELMKQFLKYCKIESFIKKYYENRAYV